MRLTRVGCSKERFTSGAISLLHEAGQGSMRDIDRLAICALRLAARTKKKLVKKEHLLMVREDAAA